MVKHPSKSVAFRLDAGLAAELEREAERQGVTVSAACRHLVQQGLEAAVRQKQLEEMERRLTERLQEGVLLVLLNMGQNLAATDPQELRRLVSQSVRRK